MDSGQLVAPNRNDKAIGSGYVICKGFREWAVGSTSSIASIYCGHRMTGSWQRPVHVC